jgi:hypothetical protein
MPVQVSCDRLAPMTRQMEISRDAHLIAYYGEELPVFVLCCWCCHWEICREAAVVRSELGCTEAGAPARRRHGRDYGLVRVRPTVCTGASSTLRSFFIVTAPP